MMADFLWTGTLLGMAIGLFHMLYILSTRLRRPELDPVKTFWQGLWTWGLWTLFGAYVLFFWLIGLVCLVVSRLLRARRRAA